MKDAREDDLRVNPRNWALVTSRPPTPEKPKSLAVPTKHRVWLHEQQRVPSLRHKARKQDNEATLMGLEYGTFDLSRCDDELLTKQGVLQQQLGPRASDVGNKTGEHWKGTCRFSNGRSNPIEYSTSYRSKTSNDAGQHEPDLAQAIWKFKTCMQRKSERSCGGGFM